MAGRGTDIMLGGNAEFLAVAQMHDKGLSPIDTPDEYEAAWDAVFASVKAHVETEAAKVVEAGGLYVLGTERHESRRIDNQLRGRSGRQGDPGESRFYLSLEDDLMRLFNAGAAEALMGRAPADMAIESKTVSRAIRSAQSQVEARNAEIRKNVLKYDDVLNRQREAIYSDRRHILEGDDLHDRVQQFLERRDRRGHRRAHRRRPERRLGSRRPVDRAEDALPGVDHGRRGAQRGRQPRPAQRRRRCTKRCCRMPSSPTSAARSSLGEQATRELERRVVLSVIDRRWRDHLYEMDYLKDGIGLRAMAQRDPLVEYQREGFALYQNMMGAIREESVGFLFNLEVEVTGGRAGTVAARVSASPATRRPGLSYSAPSADAQGEVEVRNQRGQLEQAATLRAQQAQAARPPRSRSSRVRARPGSGPAGRTASTAGPAQARRARCVRPAQDGGQPAPQNRAERRAQEKAPLASRGRRCRVRV